VLRVSLDLAVELLDEDVAVLVAPLVMADPLELFFGGVVEWARDLADVHLVVALDWEADLALDLLEEGLAVLVSLLVSAYRLEFHDRAVAELAGDFIDR
jgi:hypothetical protein